MKEFQAKMIEFEKNIDEKALECSAVLSNKYKKGENICAKETEYSGFVFIFIFLIILCLIGVCWLQKTCCFKEKNQIFTSKTSPLLYQNRSAKSEKSKFIINHQIKSNNSPVDKKNIIAHSQLSSKQDQKILIV